MTKNELLAALEITPEPMPDSVLDMNDGATTQSQLSPPSPTALTLDDWSLRRGAETLEGDILRPILSQLIDPDADADENAAHNAHVAADCLGAAFEPTPELAENCADETQGRYFRQLMETEAYQSLHAETRLDAYAAELAAGSFAQGLIALIDTEEEQNQQEPQDGQGDEPQSPEDQARQELKKDLSALSAASQALKQATEDVDDLRNAQRALGDNDANSQQLDPAALRERFDKIRNSERLRAIIDNAGRYRRLAQAKQRQKVAHGQDDVIGVELGNDLGRLLPTELAALGDEDLEMDALRRYLERGLMQRQYQGIEHKARGPIVVVVDESGSMAGERIETAKATALAMAWIARHQGRYCCLVGFSNDDQGVWHIEKPGQTDQAGLLDWLEHFYGGGTSPAVPLETVPARWEEIDAPPGETDMILITDGCMNVDHDTRSRFNEWKAQEEVKLYTLIIGEDEPGDLAGVSTRTWCLPDLSINQDAIQEIVSI